MQHVMNLAEDQLDALKSGNPVRVALPDLGGEAIVIFAAPHESLENVLAEALEDIREQKAVTDYAKRVISRTIRDDQTG